MKTTELVLLAVGGYVLYQVLKKQFDKVTDPVSTAIAKIWVSLTEEPPMQVLGDVVLPDGTTFPIAGATIRKDAQGQVYTQVAGRVYQLQPHDADGNWPAALVQ